MKKLNFFFILLSFKLFAQIPTASLIGFYPFSGNANDASGNNINGTVVGATLTTDRFGNAGSAYSFNGTNNYISLPAASYTTLNNYSWSVWIRPNSIPSNAGFVYCMGESGGVGYNQCLAYQNTQQFFAGSYNASGSPVQSSALTPSVTPNQWMHLVVTRSNTLISVYLNGTLYNTSNSSINNQNVNHGNGLPILSIIGARCNFNSSTYFSGSIDDVRIYSSILTPTDVAALMNESCFQTPPLTNYQTCTGNSVSLSAIPSASNSVSWYSSATSTTAISTNSLLTLPGFSTTGSYSYYLSSSSCSMFPKIMVNVMVNATPSISVSNGTICSGQSFTLSPTGALNYTYSGGSNVVSPINTTTYTIVGSNLNGCLASNIAIATVSVLQSPSITINNGFVCSGTSFTLNPSGASSYTYSSGSAIVMPTSNSTYTVFGDNGNNCVSSAVAFVGVVATPTISITGANSLCEGGSTTLTANGGNIYTWNTGSSNTIISVSPSVTTAYFLTGVNLFGCIGTASTLISVNPIPTISVNSGSICQGRSFTISPSGASTYTYSSGSAVVSPNSNTNYTITGTSAFGCAAAATVVSSVSVLNSPTLTISGGSICAGQSFTLSPSGANSYTFSGGSAIVSPASSTTYSVTGTALNGCTNLIPAVATITVNSLPTINAPSGAICAGNAFTINPSGAFSYTYSSGSNVVMPATNTSYSVYGTNAAGCTNSLPIVVNVSVNPIPTISVNSGSICQGRSFTITPSGASTYTYSSGSAVVSPNSNTNYTITGSSAFGCPAAATVVSSVNVLSSPTVVVAGGSICTGQSFTLSPSGANTYTFNSGSAVVSPASSTSYSVTGTALNGCTNLVPAVATITVNSLPTINAPSGAICAGNAFTINPSGAISYTYSSGSNIVIPSTTSSYSVYGTNAAGCTNALPLVVTVTVNAIPTISVNSGSICQGRSFTITPSGASTYTYSSGSALVTPNTNTNYTVMGMSAAGCAAVAPVVSSVNVLSSPTVVVAGGNICTGQSFTLSPSGANSYTFSSGNAIVSPINNTSYSVTGTALNGCTNLIPAVATITVNSLPTINAPSGAICAGNAFTINPSGAISYTYSSGSNVVMPATTSSYSVYGTNAAGCTNTLPIVVNVSVNPIPTINVNSGSICQGRSFTIAPSGASTYTYSSGSAIVSPNSNTNYTITGTSASGCKSQTPAVITISVYAAPTITVASGSICSGNSYTIIPQGANSFTFSSGNSIVSPSLTTSYSVSGTNSLGCTSNSFAILTVSVNPLPIISASGGSICSGNTFTINASGAQTYTYSSGSNTITPVVTSSYSIHGTDANGCINNVPAVIQVSVISNPTITLPSTAGICFGESYTITPSGALSYTYSGNSNIVSPSITTNYTVNGISAQGCVGSAVITISVQPSMSVSINGSLNACEGQSVTLFGNGANTYTWNNGTTTNSIIVSPNATTVYSVIAGSGICIGNSSHTLVINPNPTINIISSKSLICINETATLNVNGANTFSWSNGLTSASIVVSPTVNNTYSVVGVDSNGCSNIASITQSVDACTSIIGLENSNPSILIYPNPSAGEIEINFNTLPSNAVIEIYNYIGQLISNKPVQSEKEVLNFKDAANGVYILRITSNDKIIHVKRLIKQ